MVVVRGETVGTFQSCRVLGEERPQDCLSVPRERGEQLLGDDARNQPRRADNSQQQARDDVLLGKEGVLLFVVTRDGQDRQRLSDTNRQQRRRQRPWGEHHAGLFKLLLELRRQYQANTRRTLSFSYISVYYSAHLFCLSSSLALDKASIDYILSSLVLLSLKAIRSGECNLFFK